MTDYETKWCFEISAADPGAVPGASTNYPKVVICYDNWGQWGRNRIDARGKDYACFRHGIRRYRARLIVANDNDNQVAVAA